MNVVVQVFASAVVDKDLNVHLSFAVQFVEVAEKLPLVGADGLPKGFIIVEDGAKAEGKNSRVLKAVGNHTGVIDA